MDDNSHPRTKTPPEPKTVVPSADETHPHYRRMTPAYRARKAVVRDMWIYAGLVICLLPLAAQIVTLAALGFLSLSILDNEAEL